MPVISVSCVPPSVPDQLVWHRRRGDRLVGQRGCFSSNLAGSHRFDAAPYRKAIRSVTERGRVRRNGRCATCPAGAFVRRRGWGSVARDRQRMADNRGRGAGRQDQSVTVARPGRCGSIPQHWPAGDARGDRALDDLRARSAEAALTGRCNGPGARGAPRRSRCARASRWTHCARSNGVRSPPRPSSPWRPWRRSSTWISTTWPRNSPDPYVCLTAWPRDDKRGTSTDESPAEIGRHVLMR